MFHVRNFIRLYNIRCFSSGPPTNIVEHLKERSLIRVSGSEVSDFLQGLITNDIHHLDHGVGSMYTMFLNTKGRVLYDSIIYRTSENNSFLIECDKEVLGTLQKHLKMYRVKRKIDITSLESEFNVYALFNPGKLIRNDKLKTDSSQKLDGLIVPCTSLKENVTETSSTCKIYHDLLIYRDPRIANLGSRILAPVNSDVQKQISEIFSIDNKPQVQHSYRWFRYNLGVGEGINDLPPGNCFPLEANGDYLHGVSFHKGCYIGQELTARTHHTGVVRKRLMPLYFSKIVTKLPNENTIMNENVNLGKIRGVEGNVGLGLLRIAKALEFKEITVGDGTAVTEKPLWWPLEAPKERISVQKG